MTVTKRELVTSGSINVYPVRFEFSDDWDGLTRTAVFRAGDASRSVLLDGGNETVIPWEVLETPYLQLFCGVYGTKDGDTVFPTIWADMGAIWKGTEPAEKEARPPTPDIWEQRLETKADGMEYDGLNLSLTSGDKTLSSVQIIGGGDGGGVSGKDGFSPTVETEATKDGTIVTITGVDGEHSFTVYNDKDAATNGQTTLNIVEGENITIEQDGDSLTISATGGGPATQEVAVNAPIGAILPWSGGKDTIPEGWHICDGEVGTVDLRDRFILGAGDSHGQGDKGGSEKVELSVTQIPAHFHNIISERKTRKKGGEYGKMGAWNI